MNFFANGSLFESRFFLLIVQIFLIYFGLPKFGIKLPQVTAGVLALTINNAAYLSEIIRAGIQAIQKGQWEAASAIGLTGFQTFRLVILPQAIRNTFPAISNQFLMIIYGTSLLAVLNAGELMDKATILDSETFQTFPIYFFVMLLYYAISIVITVLLKWINRRYFPATVR